MSIFYILKVLMFFGIIQGRSNNKTMDNNRIEITDVYLVAALFAYGADYIGVDRADKKSQIFLFKRELGIEKIYTIKHGVLSVVESPNYEAMRMAYDSATLMYPPSFPESVRRVKGIIHS